MCEDDHFSDHILQFLKTQLEVNWKQTGRGVDAFIVEIENEVLHLNKHYPTFKAITPADLQKFKLNKNTTTSANTRVN